MSRGLGKYQRRIVEALKDDAPAGGFAWSIAELADQCGGGTRQTITACRTLEARELVRIRHGTVRMIESELGFRALERPVPGLLVADRDRADEHDARLRALLRGI